MSVNWTTLPAEIWLSIFDRVQDKQQLVECRCVCKAWDPLAERAMFSQAIHFRNTKIISLFYRHLIKKPHLGRCIQSLHFSLIHTDKILFYEHFFRLTFHPNIEAVDGLLGSDIYRVLLDIAKQSKQKYNKLQLLPEDTFVQKKDIQYDAILYFRETLTSLYLYDDKKTEQRIFDRLGEFKSLTKLKLNISGATDKECLTKLERILAQCPHLNDLDLTADTPSTADSMQEQELQSWLQSNVQQSYKKCTLNLSEVEHVHTLDYLIYKYPNASAIILNSDLVDNGDNTTVEHCLARVKNMDYVALSMWPIDSMAIFKQVVKAMRSKRNKLDICTDERCAGLGQIGLSKYKSYRETEFDMTVHDYHLSLNQVVKMIGNVFALDINYLQYESDPEDKQLESHLYELLTVIPKIETLKITDAHIQHQPALVENLVLKRLVEISICGAIIDADVFPALSKIAPRLECLTLDTCILDPKSYQDQHINLPQTDLYTLSILASDSVWEYVERECQKRINAYKWMQKSISVKNYQLMFLSVATLYPTQTRRYYVLKPGTPSQSKQISQDEFERSIGMWPRISITCNSLQILKLELGALVIDIDLDMDDWIQEVGDWQMDKPSALAFHLHKI